MRPLNNPYSDQGCFFCGPANPIGLKLRFFEASTEPPELMCRWTPGEHYRGLGRVLHGGLQCGLFDEIMGWTTHHFTGQSAVTGEINVRFHGPIYIGSPLELRCRITGREGRRVYLAAEIRNHQGRECSTAQGYYVLVPAERFAQIVGKDDQTVGNAQGVA
jgi:acyl-coenzyme A thioesterase PaaI-like protein